MGRTTSNREPLTLSRIRSYGPGYHYDATIPQLAVRVTAGGSRTYQLRYRDEQGKQRWLNLGRTSDYQTVDKARETARERLTGLHRGEDPKRPQGQEGKTLAEVFDLYLERHARPHKAQSSVEKDEANYRLHVADVLGSRPAASIRRADVSDLHAKIAKTSPGAAARVVALLRKVFNVAVDEEILPDDHPNPCKRIKVKRTDRKMRFLDDEEYATFYSTLATHEMPEAARGCIELIALTGMRRGEALNLQWERLHLKRRPPVAELVEHKTARRVGSRWIKLSPAAVKLLKRHKPKGAAQGRVFPGITESALEHRWKSLIEAAGFDGSDGKDRLRLHDLRHSYASMALRHGVQLPVLQQLMGHKSIQSTMVYIHVGDQQEAEAASSVGDAVAAAMMGGE